MLFLCSWVFHMLDKSLQHCKLSLVIEMSPNNLLIGQEDLESREPSPMTPCTLSLLLKLGFEVSLSSNTLRRSSQGS